MVGRGNASRRPRVLYPELMLSRLSRVALLAVLAAAATSTTAQAATFDVSRRVDPSLDRYLATETATTPFSAMTPDQQWLAANASPLVLHDSDPRVSLNVVGWAAQHRTSVYVNGTGVNLYNPIKLRQARKWLVKRGSKRVLVDGGWQMLDLRKAAARTWWLYGADKKATCNPVREERAALDLLACGYTGLWIDNALTTPKQGFTPTPKMSERSWARGVLTLLKELRRRMPAGKTFTINMHWTDTTFGYAARPKLRRNDPEIRAGRYADQVVIEGGAIDPGLHYPLSASTPWSYRRLLTFADAMHKVGTKLQWEKTSSGDLTRNRTPVSGSPKLPTLAECNDRALSTPWSLGDASWKAHVRTAAFNFSTAVLTARPGDSVGDMCEYPGRGWVGYHADLGQPTGARKDADGILTRSLERGMVIVNPNDEARTVTLPQPGVNLASLTYPQPTEAVSSVTLLPRSAAVIKF